MYVIGTAGHVDHGKSTLVKALTGIDPDRLVEERRREMTIDLGFAWLTLPSGRTVSVIDVPGHERFIKNMLAGVGGIDAALLVVAADESVMPQTAEHLAILDLLNVRRGLVVLSKADLVDDDWLALVDDEVAERLRGTSLEGAPRLPVSARTGAGLPALLAALDTLLDTTPSRSEGHGSPRLPIDRAFTVGGFGTVVTGTLLDGPILVGQEVELLPAGLRARVRGVQTHNHSTDQALPGTRVAVNLVGLHHRQIARGDVLALPGTLSPTDRLDVRLRIVPDAPRPLEQNTPLDLFVGAAETPCHATLLESEMLGPGERGWVQLRLARPIAVARGDRLIVRQASPSLTIGGGVVADAHPPRHRRFRPDVLAGLALLERGNPADIVLQALGDGPKERAVLLRDTRLPLAAAEAGLQALRDDGRAMLVGGDQVVLASVAWEQIAAKLTDALRGYHRRYPLRRGIPREDLRQRLRFPPRVADAVIAEGHARVLAESSDTAVWLAGFVPTPTPAQQREATALLTACERSPFAPPIPTIDLELLNWLVDSGALVRASEDVYFAAAPYAEMVAWVRATIDQHGSITVGQLRDRFGTSRKYGLALLEYLDQIKLTRREGEGRVLY
jgi:selenocysteine-specific elongation factor